MNPQALRIIGGLLLLWAGLQSFGGWSIPAIDWSIFRLPPVVPLIEQVPEGTWVIVVEESKTRSIDHAKLLNAGDFFDKSIPDRKLRYRRYEPDEEAGQKILAKIAPTTAPAMVIWGKDSQGNGKPIASAPLANSLADFDAWIKRNTGR